MHTVSEKIRFIESVFGKAKIYAKNVDVHCPMPACKDSNNKKLSIRLDDDVNHCWVCGWGARTLLPILIKHASQEKVQEYRTKFLPDVVDITKYKAAALLEQEQSIVKLPSDFKPLVFNTRTRDPDVKSVRRYVESRGLTEREFWYWKLGTSNDRDLRRRVIIPSYDSNGNLNYYTARAIDTGTFQRYVNSEGESRNIVFNELNIDWSQALTIVEGPFDLMKCRGNATCILGSNLSERSALFTQLLIHQTPVILMLDNDMEGKSQRIAKFLNQYNIQVKLAKLGDKDPGAMSFVDVEKAITSATLWNWDNMLAYKLRAAMSCSLRIPKHDQDSAHSGRSPSRPYTSR